MASAVIQQLDTYGPRHCESLSYPQAAAYTRQLANSHYENFSVVSYFVPKRLREDFANIYAFCRWADDLSDELGDRERSLELLAWWKKELAACYEGKPRHPVYVALSQTINRHNIPADPFEDLIDAFEQDQSVNRYETWEQTVDYCTRSANPVGHLVLYLCGYRDEHRQLLSDCTCTALQLVNFWQDVRRDILERDRIYIPRDELAKYGLSHTDLIEHAHGRRKLSEAQWQQYRQVIQRLMLRTQELFDQGKQLFPMVHGEVRLPIELFSRGGQAVMAGIRRVNYETLDKRPSVSKAMKLRLMGRALLGKWFGRRGQATA